MFYLPVDFNHLSLVKFLLFRLYIYCLNSPSDYEAALAKQEYNHSTVLISCPHSLIIPTCGIMSFHNKAMCSSQRFHHAPPPGILTSLPTAPRSPHNAITSLVASTSVTPPPSSSLTIHRITITYSLGHLSSRKDHLI